MGAWVYISFLRGFALGWSFFRVSFAAVGGLVLFVIVRYHYWWVYMA